MLSAKNTYILLCTLLVQLGCSSNYLCHMQNPGGSESGPSRENSGNRVESRCENEDIKNNICNIVNNFLAEHEGKVDKGSCIDDDTIKLAISCLSTDINSIDISLFPIDYRIFLSIYGSVYGQGYDIFGRVSKETSNEQEAEHIASVQRGFKEDCKTYNKKLEQIKLSWLIASIDESDQYYIDLSDKGKGRIYSLDRIGTSRLFAQNFVEFLSKFFESFGERQEND